MKRFTCLVLISSLLITLTACQSKSPAESTSGDEGAKAEAPQENAAVEKPAAAAPPEAPVKAEPVKEQEPPTEDESAEADPEAAAAEGDSPLFESERLNEERFDAAHVQVPLRGELKWGISVQQGTDHHWFLATTKVTPGKKVGGEPTKTGLIVVEHWTLSGAGHNTEWEREGEYKELVSDCEHELVLDTRRGPWSVTDMDGNGEGEVTFAWSAGCRAVADTPITHKVLMIAVPNVTGHNLSRKYVLRGTTREWPSRTDSVGGEFKADPEFKKAPASFLKHAEMVWQKTHEL